MNLNNIFAGCGLKFKKLVISIGQSTIQKKKTEDKAVYLFMME